MAEPKQSLALLIDGDNASPKIVGGLLAEIARYGTATVKRIYGDWTTPNLSGWKDCLLEHSIQPIQQFAYASGKNATDSAMIIDAMDLLHTGRFSAFCVVSSDSDFTRLAARVREQGVMVYGFGERKTPRPFVAVCDRFVYVDALGSAGVAAPAIPLAGATPALRPAVAAPSLPPALAAPAIRPAAAAPGKPSAMAVQTPKPTCARKRLDATALAMLREAIAATTAADGRANLAEVGSHLARAFPGFEARTYGHAQLTKLVEASGLAEVTRAGGAVRVRLRAP